jgi:ABC-type spermidine/putrescine transport system permease subunit I
MKLGYRMPLIGYLIETFFKEMNDYYLGSAAAVVLSLTMLLLMFLIGKLDRSSVKDDQGSRKKRFKDISPLGAGGGEIHG